MRGRALFVLRTRAGLCVFIYVFAENMVLYHICLSNYIFVFVCVCVACVVCVLCIPSVPERGSWRRGRCVCVCVWCVCVCGVCTFCPRKRLLVERTVCVVCVCGGGSAWELTLVLNDLTGFPP